MRAEKVAQPCAVVASQSSSAWGRVFCISSSLTTEDRSKCVEKDVSASCIAMLDAVIANMSR